ncbi:MAG TPA: tripartite tricarboxylate transporter substrate binding protein [Burkholderiales bacterium]|nr:tripartite tricarboxylate transporter substrate binding protein [Burkholderiales bacterium]
MILRAVVLALLCLHGLAYAQAYPSRTVRIIIPFPPGGTSDILARTLAQKLTEEWGQQVIAENRPGAAGNIASEFVAKQKGDPHVLLINTVGTHAINPAIYPSLPFDPIKDFTLITNLVNLPSLLIVHPSVPANTAQELIALAKSRPGALQYSSAGSGSQPHLTAEMFRAMAGVDVLHVPYKGAGPQLLALISGEVTMTFATAPAAVPLVKNKQARAIAVTTAERVAALPDVPTLTEAALPGYVAVGWNGLVGPAAIPAPIVQKIHDAVAKIYRQPDMRDRLIGLAAEPAISTPEEFSALIKSELVKWAKAVKDSGAKLE